MGISELMEQNKEYIIESYKTKNSTEIGNELGVSYASVIRYLKKWGQEIRPSIAVSAKNPNLDGKYDEVINLYQSGMTTFELATKMKCDPTSIKYILKKNGISRRGCKKHFCTKDYFKKIDTEEKAYILGFFHADGCIHSGGGRYRFIFEIADYQIVKDISNSIGYTQEPRKIIRRDRPNAQPTYTINLEGKELYYDMVRLGMSDDKTFTLEFPSEEQVPKHLLNHYLRGFIDGDGCIYYSKDKRVKVNITATQEFLDELNVLLRQNLSFMGGIYNLNKFDHNVRTWESGGKANCYKLLSWIYQDSTIHLDRKYEKWLAFKADYEAKYAA